MCFACGYIMINLLIVTFSFSDTCLLYLRILYFMLVLSITYIPDPNMCLVDVTDDHEQLIIKLSTRSKNVENIILEHRKKFTSKNLMVRHAMWRVCEFF